MLGSNLLCFNLSPHRPDLGFRTGSERIVWIDAQEFFVVAERFGELLILAIRLRDIEQEQ